MNPGVQVNKTEDQHLDESTLDGLRTAYQAKRHLYNRAKSEDRSEEMKNELLSYRERIRNMEKGVSDFSITDVNDAQ